MTPKSAPLMTVVVLVTVLFAASTSISVDVTDDVTLVEPLAFSFSFTVKLPFTVAARFGCVQVMVPGPLALTAMPVHDAPVPAVKPAYDVFDGTFIVYVTPLAVVSPLLEITTAYVTVPVAGTGSGVSVTLSTRSTCAAA